MFDSAFFSPVEPNLAAALRLLFIEFAVGLVSAFALGQLGFPVEPVLIAMSLLNLWVAWHLAKSAKAMGKNAILYGAVSALLPGLALFAYFQLRQHELLTALDRE